MPDPRSNPYRRVSGYLGLMQDLQGAFTGCEEYTLTDYEVEALYIALVRLSDLETMGHNRDWEGIKQYCPLAADA